MKSKAVLFSLLSLFSYLAGIGAPIQAAPSAGHIYISAVDKSMAAELARQAYGGKVLSVDEIKEGGQTIYRVKLLLEGGRIKIVTVDGNNGKVA